MGQLFNTKVEFLHVYTLLNYVLLCDVFVYCPVFLLFISFLLNHKDSFLKKILFAYFRQKGREGEREGEKHYCVVASHAPPTGDLDHNPGKCPDWESKWQPFGSQAGAQSPQPHQPGLIRHFIG